MKILMICINYWPEVVGIGAFATYRAEYLAEVGHDVCVCTTYPYYPEWKVPSQYRWKLASTDIVNKVKIRRSKSYVPSKVNTISRILHEISFIASSFVSALRCGKTDVILVLSPPLGLAMSAIVLAKLFNAPFVFDVQDVQPDSAGDLGMLPRWIVKFLYKIEILAYTRATLVTTITCGMRQKIASKGVPLDKIKLIEPIMNNRLASDDVINMYRFKNKYNLKHKYIVIYSGNMGIKQGLDVIVDAAEISRENKSIVYVLIGDGADRARIENRISCMGLDNIRLLPILNEEDYRGALAASAVCLLTQKKGVSEIAFPSKLVTYLSAGCAVAAAVDEECEVARVIKDSMAGAVSPPEEAELLYKSILNIIKFDRDDFKIRSRAYANGRWNSHRIMQNFEGTLQEVAGKR